MLRAGVDASGSNRFAGGPAAADFPMARPYDGPSQDEADRAPDPIECPNCPKFPGRCRNALKSLVFPVVDWDIALLSQLAGVPRCPKLSDHLLCPESTTKPLLTRSWIASSIEGCISVGSVDGSFRAILRFLSSC
jgi:hypothetical protein